MKSKFKILAFFALTLVFTCQNDDAGFDDTLAGEFSENFGTPINAHIFGKVVDASRDGIGATQISVGNITVSTDANGFFNIESASVFSKFAYIKAHKTGYINGSRALVPSDAINQIEIMLLKDEPVATINSGEASTVELINGTQVDFDGDFINEMGQNYSGQVSVVLHHLSPDDENMTSMMPGMLFAENANGQARALESFGMIAVELKGSADEDLQLAEGSTAQITIPIPAGISNAPSTIPLWYFDELNGYWKEEGFASLVGNEYVGEVSHFSFWNVDVPFPTVELCITLVDELNNTINNQNVFLKRTGADWTSVSSGTTNADGKVCGLAPANEQLVLTIRDFGCATNHVNLPLGPFSSDQDIILTVVENVSTSTTLTGMFNNCNGTGINNGYIKIYYSGVTKIIPITNGTLNEMFVYCSTSDVYTIQGVDLDSNQSTDVYAGTFASPITNLTTLMSCLDLIDSDGDQILDVHEDVNGNNNIEDDDTDSDGIPNYLDADDDGDGILTKDEDYDGDDDPTNDNTDGDNKPDYLDVYDGLHPTSLMESINCAPNFEYDLQNPHFTDYYISNHITSFHTTSADAIANVNPLPSIYYTTYLGQSIYARSLNTISNRLSYSQVYLNEFYFDYYDTDGDGLTDCEEWTGEAQGFSICQRNPISNYPSNESNPDSDGDGFDDCMEADAGTNPLDATDF